MPPLQRQVFGSTVPSGMHLVSSWSRPPNPPLPRGRARSPTREAGPRRSKPRLQTALSRSKSASPRGGGAAHPEAALRLPAPTGMQPRLPAGPPQDPRAALGLAHAWKAGGLANLEFSGSPRDRPPPPTPAHPFSRPSGHT